VGCKDGRAGGILRIRHIESSETTCEGG
jgi:hypothetical protein